MSLTAGSTLQNGKYLIRAVLHQSNFGVTYQAIHCFLNQPVILQALSEHLRQQPQFDQVQQQFLAEIHRLLEEPSPAVRVQDCFEEAGTPFIVLGQIPGHASAKLAEWVKFLDRFVMGLPAGITTSQIALEAASEIALEIAPSNGSRSPQSAMSGSPTQQRPAASAVVSFDSHRVIAKIQTATSLTRKNVGKLVPPQNGSGRSPHHSSQKRWLPTALLMTAIVTASAGAGLGLSLRFQPMKPSNGASSLFSNEQSFPPKEDWLGEDPYANSYSQSTSEFLPSEASSERTEEHRRSNSAPQPPALNYEPRPQRRQPAVSEPIPNPEPEPAKAKRVPEQVAPPPLGDRPAPSADLENSPPSNSVDPVPVVPPHSKTDLAPIPVAPTPDSVPAAPQPEAADSLPVAPQ
jgi:hypothetical protein